MKKNNSTTIGLLALFLVLLGNTFAFAQATVKGVVYDDSNESVPGANVVVRGTTSGTITDFEGTFNLEVPAGETVLEVSFVGFKTTTITLNLKNGEVKDLGKISLPSDVVGLREVQVIANVAIDRQTPVAVSTVQPEVIEEKLGSQEFPEILKSTPGVYATKQGGGFGDSRINLRGFDMKNIAVMINGIPVNDMENGWVYWSNWAGLSDVTRTIQVQRGLGASKLAIGSVGGTINVVTKTSDAEKGGSFYVGTGNDGYQKQALTLSTGLSDNGWAVSFSGAHTAGNGWVDGTTFEGWSYFVNVTKQWSNQMLSFTAFGAPQEHGQRRSKELIEEINKPSKGLRFNPDWGYYRGQETNLNLNYYHKPQMSLNHYIDFNDKLSVSTSAYVSFGTGGGTGNYGSEGGKFFDYKIDGQIDFDRIANENAANPNAESTAYLRASRNDHNWYGALSTTNYKINEYLDLSAGIDVRYYKGFHYREVVDLMGGDFAIDTRDVNNPNKVVREGDIINYNNTGEVAWEGLFAQLEYKKDALSAFVAGAWNNTSYRRTDYFNYTDVSGDQVSEWIHHQGFVAKMGANYNINEHHNIFGNLGYFERTPFFDAVFIEFNNEINEGVKNEKTLSFELGYGFRSTNFSANVNAYYTNWIDKFLQDEFRDEVNDEFYRVNLSGVNALHQGVEIDFTYKPLPGLDINGMVSVGDWVWNNNLENVYITNDDLEVIDTVNVFMKGLKVGDAAQTTIALGLNYKILDGLKLGADFNYFDNLYAQFDPVSRSNTDDEGVNAWRLPNYYTLDMNLKYTFEVAGLEVIAYGKVNNLLNKEYISEADDGAEHDWQSARVFYGIGRTWSTGLKLNF